MPDLLEEIRQRENELNLTLWKRMDNDTNLIDLIDRVLRDTGEPPAKIPNSIYVPLNDLKVFVTTVEAFLSDSEEQVVVTSEDKNLDTADIESIIKALWKSVDERWMQGEGTGGRQFAYKPFVFQQTTRRGRVIIPCAFRIENSELVSDLRAWDSRYTTSRPREWMCYRTNRSAAMLRADYPEDEYPQIKNLPDVGDLDVRNIWTKKENIVFVGDLEVMRLPHDYGYVPGVQQIVPIGSFLVDQNAQQFEGESILLMVRDIFPELVRLASYIQTLNSQEVDHALQERVDKSDIDVLPPDHDEIADPRSVTKTTGGFTPIPIGELRVMAGWLQQMLETRMQRGGLSSFDMGTFNQAMSAVALIRVGAGRDRVYGPRLACYGQAKILLTKMAIKQLLQAAEAKRMRSLKIAGQTYDLAILKHEYDIDFTYRIRDTTIDVAKQSLAVSQRGMIPRVSILRDTLQRDDPEGDLRELYSEEAELMFPNIKKYRILRALAEKAEKGDTKAEIERDIGLADLGISLEQLFAGQIPNVVSQEPPKPALPMLDLFEGNAGNPASNMTKGAT